MDEDDDEPFRLVNDRPKPKPKPVQFETLKATQLPLIRGLGDCPNQQDLFDDMTAN